MHEKVAPRFEFIRNLHAEDPEEEIQEAEKRFARLLDILADVAVRQTSQSQGFDNNAKAP